MKIDAVELMRSAREELGEATDGMSWSEEQEYLRTHRGTFAALLTRRPDQGVTGDPLLVRPRDDPRQRVTQTQRSE